MKSIIVRLNPPELLLRFGASALLLLTLTFVAPFAAHGADWVETEGARLRIVVGRAEGDGERRAMLDVDLKPGWKTYWREPGESGIPPTIDVGPAGGAKISFEFPAPVHVTDAYGGFIGYVEPVRLPVVLPADTTEAEVFLGVCQQVCIPVSASFKIQGTDEPSPLHAAMVDQAFEALPSEPTEHLQVRAIEVSEDGQSLTIVATAAGDRPAQLFLAPLSESGHVFGMPELAEAENGRAVFTLPILQRPSEEKGFPRFSATLVQGQASIRQDIAVE